MWYGASKLDRETFRQQLLDPLTNDKTVDRLRSAAKGIVEGETYARLNAAGDDLATAAQTIGLDRWPQFLGNAERRGFAAVSDGMIPGVVKASATGTDIETSFGIGLGLVLLTPFFKTLNSGPARPSITPTMPSNLPQEKPGDGKSGSTQVAPSPTPKKEPDDLAQPGDATLAEDRRKYILDGNGRGGGGHGPGRATPGKSTFPPDWSDEKAIEAVKEVANDPASVREPADGGRTAVTGTRDGVKIEVIIGRDRKAIITAYPIEAGSEKK